MSNKSEPSNWRLRRKLGFIYETRAILIKQKIYPELFLVYVLRFIVKKTFRKNTVFEKLENLGPRNKPWSTRSSLSRVKFEPTVVVLYLQKLAKMRLAKTR